MIEIVTDRNQLPTLKQEWDKLAAKFKSPLLEFDWFNSCLETINRDNDIRIVLIKDNQKISAIAPLCIVSHHGSTTLEIIGASILFEPTGFLYRTKSDLNELLNAIIKLNISVSLLRFPSNPDIIPLIDSFSPRRALIIKKQTSPSAYLDINSSWEDFLNSLSSNRRYDFKRKRKRLAKEGEIRLEIVNPSNEMLAKYLQSAFVVENKSWKARNGTSLLKNDKLKEFFVNYSTKAGKNGELRMCFIYLDDSPISMHIALVSHEKFWVLKLGYDEALAKCSPGIQLTMDSIEYSFENNLSGYEFLGSKEMWQNTWPIKLHDYYTILIFPYSFRGIWQLVVTIISVIKSKIIKPG